ncbi:hypothetical protein [Rhizobium sp. C4]|uniref:hypothetical protein n=1 Tax=Rhizobium sp. C4 TaxID=1349800 RepID=UPI001E3E3A8F|nr:hypothetical protein [Rhizobium sp. C4]MCD2171582.1 hypothetical protein [Rhizobium sp. C4]
MQIRQLLAGKGWYDLTLSGIAMPGPYVSPWSRLIDAPYVAITWVLSHLMPIEQAVKLAFNLWPPVLMLVFAWFSAGCMKKLMPAGQRPALLHVLVAALAMSYASLEFVPGRIDHHNVQLVTLAAASYGVLCWSVAGGVLMAVALALSVTIGLETLPLITVLWAGLGLAWIGKRPGADDIFRAFSASIAIAAPLATLVFAGPAVMFGVHNDIFSAPYLAAFTGFGLISALAATLLPANAAMATRFAALAIPGLLLLAGIVATMPGVLAGPYAIIDPLSRSLWLEHVDQEHTVLLLIRSGQISATFNLALQVTISLCAGGLALRSLRAGQAGPAVVLAMGVAAFMANLDAFRFIRFPAAILPLFIPQMLGHIASRPPQAQKRLVSIFGAIVLGSACVFQAIASLMPVQRELNAVDAADFLMNDTCSAADRKAMKALPLGRYMVTPAVGLAILEQQVPGVDVADISYHRASPGMRLMFEALYSADPAARKEGLSPFDYVAFCTYPEAAKARFTPPGGSLFEALLKDAANPALIPQPVAGSRHLKLYRIDHDRL